VTDVLTFDTTDRRVKVDLGNGLWLETVTIADLKEQDVNAHVMTPATFERLVENIRRTGRLESTPYCAQPNGTGAVEVVSGHHRIRAARKAGLTDVEVLIDRNDLTRSQIIAKQLAHNAIVGTDDQDLVRQLVAQITSVDDLLESGLGEDLLPTPEKFKVTLFAPHADYKWKTARFVFLSHQLDQFTDLAKSFQSEDKTLVVGFDAQFEAFIKAVAAFGKERNIVSAATAISVLTELATEQAAELKEQREAADSSKPITKGPLVSQLFGSARVPPDAADVIRQALDKMVAAGDLETKTKWLALERWAADYLAGA
jgi:ParB-like nuclease domain